MTLALLRSVTITVAVAALVVPTLGQAQSKCGPAGEFKGSFEARFLPNGRAVELLSDFKYVDPSCNEWLAPAGSIVDGASIPQAFWSYIGGPFEGVYRDASVIHDVYCETKSRPWQEVHRTFYWAMLARGVAPWRAKLMFTAVYHFGPRWEQKAGGNVVTKAPIQPSPREQQEIRTLAASLQQISAGRPTRPPLATPPPSPPKEIDPLSDLEQLKLGHDAQIAP